MVKKIYVFKRFERFWHWAQALLIIVMLTTGFEIHGTYALLGYQLAQEVHTTAAWTLIVLWVFAIFWHFTTGEWRQYIPTARNLLPMIRYYVTGIFTGAPHPFRPTRREKHNPLQRLAYLCVKIVINPLIWVSGLLYLYYPQWSEWGLGFLSLGPVALVHTAAAFMMLLFLIVHVYVITTGHSMTSQLKAMITGYEEVDEEDGETDGADK